MPKIGDSLKGLKRKKGVPPVILQLQPTSFVVLSKPEELKQWEEDVKRFHGVDISARAINGRACETCSAGCTDDCGIM